MYTTILSYKQNLLSFLNQIKAEYLFEKNYCKLISFVTEIDNDIEDQFLNSAFLNLKDIFYYEKPFSNAKYFGYQRTLDISFEGENRFKLTSKKIQYWKNNFYSNLNLDFPLPLFWGYAKFFDSDESEMWKDFSNCNWFVPKILLVSQNQKYFLVYNFLLKDNSNFDDIVEEYNKINALLSRYTKTDSIEIFPTIVSSGGNLANAKKQWSILVDKTLNLINQKEVQKIVVSRNIELKISSAPQMGEVFQKYRNNFPNCFLFAFKNDEQIFFGATPELLFKISDNKLFTEAIAGSTKRGKDLLEDDYFASKLLADLKNVNEHNFVIDYITNAIAPFVKDYFVDNDHEIRKLKNIQHISTTISGILKENVEIFNLIDKLYPTPAICGVPKTEAMNFIKQNELYPRGLYSGLIGCFNFSDFAEFVVGIRSALYTKNTLHAFAGCGIVKSSHPVSEFIETELKLKPILSLFNYEN